MIDEIAEWASASARGAVGEASFDGFSLSVGGGNWGFGCTSPWRVVGDGDLVAGCGDPNAATKALQGLIGAELEGVQVQGNAMRGDPVLVFSTGVMIEVFADTQVDPWIFVTPHMTYVGVPGDARYNR